MSVHDMEKAEATYGGFMATLKWAIPVIALITFAVVATIAS
jgi:glycerol-3-phosphate acyltransferase PlsY